MVAIYLYLLNWISEAQPMTASSSLSWKHNAVINYLISNDIKQYSHTTAANSEHTNEILKKRNIINYFSSIIWESIYGCAEHYICYKEFYLLSMFSKSNNITINRGISAPGHVREFLVLLTTLKKCIRFKWCQICNCQEQMYLIHKWKCTIILRPLMWVFPKNFKNTCLAHHKKWIIRSW